MNGFSSVIHLCQCHPAFWPTDYGLTPLQTVKQNKHFCLLLVGDRYFVSVMKKSTKTDFWYHPSGVVTEMTNWLRKIWILCVERVCRNSEIPARGTALEGIMLYLMEECGKSSEDQNTDRNPASKDRLRKFLLGRKTALPVGCHTM